MNSSQKRKSKSKISPFVVMETSKINVIVDEEAQNARLFESNYKQQASSLGVSSSLPSSSSLIPSPRLLASVTVPVKPWLLPAKSQFIHHKFH